ncbi:PREDICTED: RNA exonuclease 4 [Condylura cristata]|uniref:RNA exonuclease 4 n=1 Tax=Condylura cristata TaxID=143302 RepID=UPI00033450FE|nr:PREDICTED: RNA exonuclease 4 [Condylura cristata]
MDPQKQPKVARHNREISGKVKTEEMGTEGPEPALRSGKGPAPPTQASGARKRADGSLSSKRGDIKHKKRKTKAAPAAPAPAPSIEGAIWFDDVDPDDIEAAIGPEAAEAARKQLGQGQGQCGVTLVKEQAFGGLTKALALDCEMVGVGPKGEESVAARVSLVNQFGKCVYDKYVRPAQPVTDYRTAVSGIRPEHLGQGERFDVVQKEVAGLLRGRILVGHALHNDLKVLLLDHPKKKIRDTQKYKPFKSQVKSGRPSLKLLAKKILGVRVQEAEHCSVQDAQAAMRLYVAVKREWENAAKAGAPRPPPPRDRRDGASGDPPCTSGPCAHAQTAMSRRVPRSGSFPPETGGPSPQQGLGSVGCQLPRSGRDACRCPEDSGLEPEEPLRRRW